jgi:hypothetical protein
MLRKVLLTPEWALSILMVVLLAALALVTRFDGLYGQDAHEYLRQCGAIFVRLAGYPAGVGTAGDAAFGGGYPFWGAVGTWLSFWSKTQVLQAISWLSVGAVVFFYVEISRWWVPGGIASSRWVGGLILLSAPYTMRCGWVVMSDALALAGVLAMLRFGIEAVERQRWVAVVLAGVSAGVSVSARFAMLPLVLPWCIGLLVMLWQQRQVSRMAVLCASGLVGFLPHVWVKWPLLGGLGYSVLMNDWSLWHFFGRSFTTVGTGTHAYWLPNILHLFGAFVHPQLCFFLPVFFFLFKKTDLHWWAQRWLLASICGYALLIGGLPVQTLRYVWPLWCVVLVLLYPAIDRAVAYGSHFKPTLLRWALLGVLAVQAGMVGYSLRPLVQLQRRETGMSAWVEQHTPRGAQVYTFEVDIALKTYLPDRVYANLWSERYDAFDLDAFALVHPDRWAVQWAGKNPMLNWEVLRSKYELRLVSEHPEGWRLYQIEGVR